MGAGKRETNRPWLEFTASAHLYGHVPSMTLSDLPKHILHFQDAYNIIK
jgi:hypothetical protein